MNEYEKKGTSKEGLIKEKAKIEIINHTHKIISPSNHSEGNKSFGTGVDKNSSRKNEINLSQKNEINSLKMQEKIIKLTNGCAAITIILLLILISIILIIIFSIKGKICLYLLPIPCLIIIISLILTTGFITIQPNNAAVLTYYGKYIGTCKQNGYFWNKPCTKTEMISLKSNQYNGRMIKVNDKNGNPVLIGVVAVWKIRDTAKATFEVNHYYKFVSTQVESGIRYICCRYPYESNNPDEPCLKAASEEINHLLKVELDRRINLAGIEIEDARITEISYGPEIEGVMLKKQAADITVVAKEMIANGAIDIIEDSIKEIEEKKICEYKADEKTKLVTSMLITLNIGQSGSALVKI